MRKRMLSIVLTVCMLLALIPISSKAASYQHAMWFFKSHLQITNGASGHSYNAKYPYRKPVDFVGPTSGIDSAYAPFDCKVVKIDASQGNMVAFESTNQVYMADGSLGYVTFMLAHDDNISDLYVGKTFSQGSVIYQEGSTGESSGNHIHVEVAKGRFSTSGDANIWTFVRSQSRAVLPNVVFYLYPNTTIKAAGGYTWKTYNTHEHFYGHIEYTFATCTKAGKQTHTCSCGASYSETIPALGHNYGSWTTTKAATCTATGTQTRKCTRCSNSETQSIAALGHSYAETVVKPTTTSKGYTLHKCQRCGDTYKDAEVPALPERPDIDFDGKTVIFSWNKVEGAWGYGGQINYAEPKVDKYGDYMETYMAWWCSGTNYEHEDIPDDSYIVNVTTYAEEGEKVPFTIGSTDESVRWLYNGSTHTLIIAGTGDMGDCRVKPWASFQNNIQRVEIKPGVTSIADNAFSDCAGLREITVPEDVMEIAENAFNNCAALSDVYYGGSKEMWNKIYVGNNGLGGVQIHYGKTESPSDVSTTGFVDVTDPNSYFYEPVDWAVRVGVTTGTDETHFTPDGSCTRAQAVTFIWRTAGCPEPENENNPFGDVAAGEYYYKAVLWAVEQGITKGTSDTMFSPDDLCTRAHIVTFLHRFEGSPETPGGTFADVPEGAYYFSAVRWAVLTEVTNGTGNGVFSPGAICTRGQIVTFLYRDQMHK